MLMFFFSRRRRKQAIVFGASNVSTSEAVQEALLAIRNAKQAGYDAISIGGGAGLAAGPPVEKSDFIPFGGTLITVYVLLEGPVDAPDLVPATGIPVT